MAKENLRKRIRARRLGQWLRVNARLIKRRIRRIFKSSETRRSFMSIYAARVFTTLSLVTACCVVIGGSVLCVRAYHSVDRKIERKLTYPDTFDRNVPYFRTLAHLGSSNHLCVTVRTTSLSNFKNRTPALENGGVNLRLTFADGKSAEAPLRARHRADEFTAGRTDYFIVTLPFGKTPFDISAASLVLTPGADGKYGDWQCDYANLSFLLGGKRVLIARESWQNAVTLGSGGNKRRSVDLTDTRQDNQTYQQYAALFSVLNKLSEAGLTDLGDQTLRAEALASLNVKSATALYLDVETVSAATGSQMLSELSEARALPDYEELNYNGVLYADITLNGRLSDGGYTRRYPLDTPGKDDFELGSSSTFRIDLPEGFTVFDVIGVTIGTMDTDDAWAPRFLRLYVPLDYGRTLEVARLTDASLKESRDTAIFYKGFLDTGAAFDLTCSRAVPDIEARTIKEEFGFEMSGASYALYFEKQSFYARQILFYEQMLKLYAPTAKEAEQ